MGQIGSDTGSVDNIVESELIHQRAGFHKKGERL